MLVQQLIDIFTQLKEQVNGLVLENLMIFEKPLYNALLLSIVSFFTFYFVLTKSESRSTSTILNGIVNHIMYIANPIIDFLKNVYDSVLQLLNQLKNVLTFHLTDILSQRMIVGRFFSPAPAPIPPKVVTPSPVVEKITETNIDDLINTKPKESSPSVESTDLLNEWIYGNKSHTRKQPEIAKNTSSKNKHVIAYGGDVNRDLNNACNVDLKHVLSYSTLNYGIPLSNCHLVSQINRRTDIMVEFVDELTTLVNQTKKTNQKWGTMKETSHTNVWSVLNKVLRSIDPSKPSFVLFHYSGHGAQIKDLNGDEENGKDEYILSGRNTIITDDELFEGFIDKLPSNCTLLLQMDQCFSGTSTDLPYKYYSKTNTWRLNNQKSPKCKAYSVSACNDKQYAYQSYYTTDGGKGEEGGPLSMTMTEQELSGNPLYCEIDNMTEMYKVVEKSVHKMFKQESFLLASESAK